ncbi:Outer-membrane lipoprotein carrier protein (fragment) [Beijerinckiaceae bacterium RH CH11]
MQKQAICLFSSLFLGLTAQLAAAQAAPSPSDYVTITGAEADKAISKADSFLSSAQTMVGDFEQKGQDGRVSQGKIYIQKPGKLRFEYAAPAALEVIADGSNVAVNDRRMKTQNTYSIGQTPLKFLLEDKIDLKADTQILNVLKTPDAVMILLDDRTTFGGTSRIRLIFDKDTYELRAWQVRDPQGYETLVTLYNIDLAMKPDPKLFKISALDQSKN